MANRMYILYDSRAWGGQGTDDATVLMSCDSEAEAKDNKSEFGGSACYSYCINGTSLDDEQWEWDYKP